MKLLKKIFSYEMFRSFLFFIQVFKKRHYDVVLYYSVIYNRNRGGKNSTIKPLIEVFEDLGVKYLLLEESDLKGRYSGYRNNPNAIPFDFISLVSTIIGKIYRRKISDLDQYGAKAFVAKKIKKFFFKNFFIDIYITTEHHSLTLWREISPKARIAIYKLGLTNKVVKPVFEKKNKVDTLVYSDFFKKLLIKNDITAYYNSKNIINIGKANNSSENKNKDRGKTILFTSQMCPELKDFNLDTKYIKVMNDFFTNNADFFRNNRYKILFRHHPRYVYDDRINLDYDFIEFLDSDLNNLLKRVGLHITVYSATAIDASLHKIPTMFIYDDNFKTLSKGIFFNLFNYPFENLFIKSDKPIDIVLKEIEENFQFYKGKIFEWGKYINNDFKSDTFKEFLLEKLHKNEKK